MSEGPCGDLFETPQESAWDFAGLWGTPCEAFSQGLCVDCGEDVNGANGGTPRGIVKAVGTSAPGSVFQAQGPV